MPREVEQIEINSLRFGIQCNFPHFCGEEQTRFAIETLDKLDKENEKLYRSIAWIKKQYDADFTQKEIGDLEPRDEAIYGKLVELLEG